MKRFAIGLVAVMGISGGLDRIAQAADLPMKAPAMIAAAAPMSWTGFYVGGHIGWGWGTKEWSNSCDAVGNLGCFSPTVVARSTASGFLGGVQAGYNYQINTLVLGVEGDFSWADVSVTSTCFGGISTCSSKADWFGTLAGRIGGTVGPALFYAKGGAAWVHDKYAENCPTCSLGSPVTWDGGQTRAGWMVGAGIEYAFARNWSAKIEYDFMDFGTTSVRMTDLPVAFPIRPTAYNVDILQRVNVVKAGVNYRF